MTQTQPRLAPYVTRTTCRACDGATLTPVLDLGLHPLPDFTQRTPEAAKAVPRAPLVLVRCDGCGLTQLRDTVDRSVCFGPTYPYRSGVNATMRAHLQGIVEQARSLVPMGNGDIVIDIGSNDGTLLAAWARPPRLYRHGFEPSMSTAMFGKYQAEDLGLCPRPFRAGEYWKTYIQAAHVVTSIAMMYDVDNPREFVADVAKVLHPDGVWVNEFNYLPLMVANNAFDHIGHEHLCYYRLADILPMYEAAGLEVFHVETNTSNGGSLRVLAAHKGKRTVDGTVEERRHEEEWDYPIQAWNTFAFMPFDSHKMLVIEQDSKGAWVYGASTRGLTILHSWGLDERYIVAAADRNPDKWGCYIPGTGIPIVSEDDFRKAAPAYALVLPYSFEREFIEREAEWLKGGGRFIFPLPQVRIVGA